MGYQNMTFIIGLHLDTLEVEPIFFKFDMVPDTVKLVLFDSSLNDFDLH